MIMKTSVLLSWEFPDNYNSPTPYKVRPLGGGRARSGVGARGRVGVQRDSGLSGVRLQLGSRLSLGLGLSQD